MPLRPTHCTFKKSVIHGMAYEVVLKLFAGKNSLKGRGHSIWDVMSCVVSYINSNIYWICIMWHSDFSVYVYRCMCLFVCTCLGWSREDHSVRMLGLVGDLSSSLVACVVTGHFSYSHPPTIGSVWSCSVMLGTQDTLKWSGKGKQGQRLRF